MLTLFALLSGIARIKLYAPNYAARCEAGDGNGFRPAIACVVVNRLAGTR